MPVSQDAGPLKWTWQGGGLGGHSGVALSTVQPGAACVFTVTGTSTVFSWSMFTAIGGGGWTLTPGAWAVTFNLTAGPGAAWVASANAVTLSAVSGPMTSARPGMVALIFEGPLVMMMPGLGGSR